MDTDIFSYNHINVQVFHLLEDLDAAGNTSSPRGFVTREANLATLEIDPMYSVMDFEPREFNFKYFVGELAWYLKAETSIDFINNFSTFWKNICPTGHANSNYGNILFKPHPSTVGKKHHTSSGTISEEVNQLDWIYGALVADKNSRQAVGFFNSPYFQYIGNKDFVCTMYISFWIQNNYLDMKVQMRSNDIFFGLTYDAPWFSAIQQSMYFNLKKIYPDLKMGIYYHCADNIHFYERHFGLVDKILDSPLKESIELKLKVPLFTFKNYRVSLTDEAKHFVDTIDEIIKKGNVPKDLIFWKKQLLYLYEIT